MKPNKLITIFLILTLFFAFSCQKSDVKELTNEKAKYDKIGVMHNQGLEYAFKSLKAAKENGKLAKFNDEDYINLLFESTYYNAENNNCELSKSEIEQIKSSLVVTKNRLIKLTNTKADEFIYQTIIGEAESLLTTRQKEISQEILRVMTESSNIETVLNDLNQIEAEINSTCDDNEKVGLLSMLSVAKHSSEYWNSNLTLWTEEFGLSKNGAKFSWGLVGCADAAYALLTGIECSPALCVPFIGWGAYLGIVGGGTVIVSGWACIAQII